MTAELLTWALLITSVALLAAQLLVQQKRNVHMLFAIFCGSIAMMATKQLTAEAIGPYQHLIGIGTCATCNGYWLVARAIFRRESAVLMPHIMVAGFVAILLVSLEGLKFTEAMFLAGANTFDAAYIIIGELLNMLSSGMLLLALWEGLSGFNRAMYQERAQRLIFLTSMGGAVFFCAIISKLLVSSDHQINLVLVAISAIQILIVTQGLILWRFHASKLKSLCHLVRPSKMAIDLADPLSKQEEPSKLNKGDLALGEAIEGVLVEQKLFLQANLRVADIARRLDEPEYKVSRALRHQLQARNFNQHVNALRVGFAIGLLEDPTHNHWPALTIALESGFGSFAAFTRAFKAEHNCTPGEYRQSISGKLNSYNTHRFKHENQHCNRGPINS